MRIFSRIEGQKFSNSESPLNAQHQGISSWNFKTLKKRKKNLTLQNGKKKKKMSKQNQE